MTAAAMTVLAGGAAQLPGAIWRALTDIGAVGGLLAVLAAAAVVVKFCLLPWWRDMRRAKYPLPRRVPTQPSRVIDDALPLFFERREPVTADGVTEAIERILKEADGG